MYDVRLPLLGDYQASNALARRRSRHRRRRAGRPRAAGAAGLKGVKGRLEIVGEVRGGLAVIDYAHKPEALAAALEALRPFAPGKLVCVFGCGGDRDKGKRPIMGRDRGRRMPTSSSSPTTIRAARGPEAIRAEILAGAPGAREIGDRAEAIRAGVAPAGPRATCCSIAGKGHETGQIVGSTVLPFSDHDAVRAALAEAPIHG